MIKIDNLSFHYGFRKKKTIFDGLNLQLSSGSIYGLLGENGVGKSTLLYLIAGLLTPQKGKVTFDGTDVRLRTPGVLSHTFLIPEEVELPSIKLKEYVAINAPFYPNFSTEDMKRNLDEFELNPDLHLNNLSMGQKKKVFMSFALATNSLLYLMDEPTNGLDIPGKSHFRQFIASNMNEEKTIVISTHQVRDIDLLLDHVTIMSNERILLNKSISDISEHLSFINSENQELRSKAIYSQPSLQGYNMIIPNDGTTPQGNVNIESLFNMVIKTNPEELNKIFNSNSITE